MHVSWRWEKRLSIHSRANSDRFHLARFPETGAEHSEDCVYYGSIPTCLASAPIAVAWCRSLMTAQ